MMDPWYHERPVIIIEAHDPYYRHHYGNPAAAVWIGILLAVLAVGYIMISSAPKPGAGTTTKAHQAHTEVAP